MNKRQILWISSITGITSLCFIIAFHNNSHRIEDSFAASPEDNHSSLRTRTRTDKELISSADRRRAKDLAVQKIHKDLLERYPEFKIQYRDVPDELNGYLQLIKFAANHSDEILPDNLSHMLKSGESWDGEQVAAWLSKHPDFMEEIFRIAELPDRSMKDAEPDREQRLSNSARNMIAQGGYLLAAKSRLLFEAGDHESALRYMRGALGICDHLTQIEAPSVLHRIYATHLQRTTLTNFSTSFLPKLEGDPVALRKWRDAIYPPKDIQSEFYRTIVGEWNFLMGTYLPRMLEDYPGYTDEGFDSRDPVLDDLTQMYQVALTNSKGQSGNGVNISFPDVNDRSLAITPTGRDFLKKNNSGLKSIFEQLRDNETSYTMEAAAISGSIGDEMPIDPVSGLSFRWDDENQKVLPPESEDQLTVPTATSSDKN